MRRVLVVSGGLDSVTLAHYLKSKGHPLHLLSFDYGQRHSKELEFAQRCAVRLNAECSVIDISGVSQLLHGSALTDGDVEVPDGHYDDKNMSVTVVPNRNAIMLSIAFSVAAANGAEAVAIGVHGGDHHIYPDCRPEFIRRFADMERASLGEYASVELLAPFAHMTKADIVRVGSELGVPFGETWSCYRGLDHHCGRCGTCLERIEAFALAGVTDPTVYVA